MSWSLKKEQDISHHCAPLSVIRASCEVTDSCVTMWSYAALVVAIVGVYGSRVASSLSMTSTIPSASMFSSWYSDVMQLVDRKGMGWETIGISEEYGGGGHAKVGVLGTSGGSRRKEITFVSEAFRSDRLHYARMVSFSGSGYDVFNLLLMPKTDSCLPIFGADIVCLPGGALAAIDFQPSQDASSMENYYESDLYAPHKNIFEKWQSKLPAGGDLPEAAQKYFSPSAIWTRIPPPLADNPAMQDVHDSLLECLDIYLDIANGDLQNLPQNESLKPDPAFLEGYLRYRIENDPAKNLLVGAFGKTWTHDVLEKILFPPML